MDNRAQASRAPAPAAPGTTEARPLPAARSPRKSSFRGSPPMCPLCLATAALVLGGATAAGGVAALVVRRKRNAKDRRRRSRSNESNEPRGARDASSKDGDGA